MFDAETMPRSVLRAEAVRRLGRLRLPEQVSATAVAAFLPPVVPVPRGGGGVRPVPSRVDYLRRLASMAPGPPVVAALAEVDLASLDAAEGVGLARAVERQLGWLAALGQRAAVAVGGAEPDAEDWGREELAGALRLAPATADRRLQVARALVARLPAGLAALQAGDCGYLHAAALVEETALLPAPVAVGLADRLLPRAASEPVGRFRTAVRRAAAAADPLGAEARHTVARELTSDVRLWPEADGMATLAATLPATLAMEVYDEVDARCGPAGPGDDRRVGERRAAALLALIRAGLSGGSAAGGPAGGSPTEPAGAPGSAERPRVARRIGVNVTVDLATLLGLAERPGELAGYGPIPASLARALGVDAAWRRLVTDPTSGALLDRSPRAYRPGAALRDYIYARDGGCFFPGCGAPVVRCDLHHSEPFGSGGQTVRANLGPGCERHHRLGHEAGWTLERDGERSWTWTSPTGERYTCRPVSYHPDG